MATRLGLYGGPRRERTVDILAALSVESASELTAPTLAVDGTESLLANDVESASEVTSPSVAQIHALLSTSVESASELTAPTLVQLLDELLADDIQALSEVSRPALSDGTVQATANKGGRARKGRRYYVVEVDGQDFIVTSQAEVRSLLQQAKALAEQAALTEAEKPQSERKVPRIRVRTGSGNKTSSIAIQREIRDTRAEIERIYADAARKVAEIRKVAERTQQALQDEEDAIIALLM